MANYGKMWADFVCRDKNGVQFTLLLAGNFDGLPSDTVKAICEPIAQSLKDGVAGVMVDVNFSDHVISELGLKDKD